MLFVRPDGYQGMQGLTTGAQITSTTFRRTALSARSVHFTLKDFGFEFTRFAIDPLPITHMIR